MKNQQRKNQKLLLGAVFIIITFAAACSRAGLLQNNGATKLQIVATFYPLYDITKRIAGDRADVYSLVPSGVEPHDYEPTPNDILKLNMADAFVTIGLEFSNVENKLTESGENKILLIDAKKGIKLLNAQKFQGWGAQYEKNSGKDVHIWLSPKNMMAIAANIRDNLKAIDSKNADYYEENTRKTIEELENLDAEYITNLSNCKKNMILTNHISFAYLGADYGFSQIGIFGLKPEAEPNPQDIVAIKNEATRNKINYIFTEELIDTRVARTIAKEIGAKTLVLNPIEGIKDSSEDYFSLMRNNLANLKLALECS